MPGQPTRILSTRPLDAGLLQEAAQQGIVLDTLSFIETRPVQDNALGSRIRDLAERPLIAIFTSMNAVEAVAGWLRDDTPPDNRAGAPLIAGHRSGIAPVPWKIFCIGSATQQLVQEYFGNAAIAGTAGSALALAGTIIRQWPELAGSLAAAGGNARNGSGSDSAGAADEVFFFCGDQRRDELPQTLTGQGIRVNEWVVYTTLRTPHRVEQYYDAVAFFSPSAVHSFFFVNTTMPPATILFAIGQTTAEAIRQYTANRTIVSAAPEKETLIRQAIDHFKNLTEQEPENHL